MKYSYPTYDGTSPLIINDKFNGGINTTMIKLPPKRSKYSAGCRFAKREVLLSEMWLL